MGMFEKAKSALCSLIAVASISGCLAPAESDSIGVAAGALEPWESAISWSPNRAPIAAPPPLPVLPVAQPLAPAPAPDTEPAEPPAPSRPATLPLSAGAAVFAQIAACRQSAAGQGGAMATARAMACMAGVLRSAASH